MASNSACDLQLIPPDLVRYPLRVRRLLLELSQAQVADQATLHRSEISRIERGKRPVSKRKLGLLAKALCWSESQLSRALEVSADA